MKCFLGIDTSCYTTSVALFDIDGNLVADERRILQVKEGGCGLQQQEMLFQHTRALPELLEKVLTKDKEIFGVAVSGTPRPQKESYMPAFLAGLGVARGISAALKVKLIIQSHQENHLYAGLWSCGEIINNNFLMLHASGGTTDLLFVQKNKFGFYDLKNVGGSIDLHAGQFIDRIGVALGLQFPTGKELEKLAADAKEKIILPVSVNRTEISLSGPCTAALKKLQQRAETKALALGVEECLGETFGRMLKNGAKVYNIQDVLMVGGVASNQHIRQVCQKILDKENIKLHCAKPEYSCDCAVGNAYRAWLNFEGETK